MKKSKKKLGELLMEAGLINEFQLKAALAYQMEWGGRLGSIIIKRGFVSEKDLTSVLENQFGLKCLSLENIEPPDNKLKELIKLDMAKKFSVFPLRLDGTVLSVALSDPTDLKTIDDVSFMLGVRLKPLLALESDIQKAIALHYEGNSGPGKSFTMRKESLESFSEKDILREREPEAVPIPPEPPKPSQEKPKGKSPVPPALVIESLIDLLVAKKVITRQELISLVKSKAQKKQQ